MSFQQSWILWGLALMVLPILIHLLNRLRYRSVQWAAMMFLIAASRSSVRRARLRHYIILLLRTLVIGALIFALARPLVGGWLGMIGSSSPETVILLFDRSVSMEDKDPSALTSKRETALKTLMNSARDMGTRSRYIMIENAMMKPEEIGDLTALSSISLTRATDTAADIPAMLRLAVNYILQNNCGRSEIWVISDLQSSNWNPDSAEWESLNNQIQALPQKVRLRLLAMTGETQRNTSVCFDSIERRPASTTSKFNVLLKLMRSENSQVETALSLNLNGLNKQEELKITERELRLSRMLDVGNDKRDGWGKFELPADMNPRDNACYFVYRNSSELFGAVVADSDISGRILQFAAAPNPKKTLLHASRHKGTTLNTVNWTNISLIIWQAQFPSPIPSSLGSFIEKGGTVLVFPPGKQTDSSQSVIRWGEVETTSQDKPFYATIWDRQSGPFANSESGAQLPLDEIPIYKRQNITLNSTVSNWHVYAEFKDKVPLLVGGTYGNGTVYICTTLPEKTWSSFHESTVLLPMIQRIFSRAGQRFSSAATHWVGRWRPVSADEDWKPVKGEEGKDFHCDAGIYKFNDQMIALNVPPEEMDPERMDVSQVPKLLPSCNINVLEAKRDDAGQQAEMWPFFLILSIIFLLVESILLITEHVSQKNKQGQVESGSRPDSAASAS